jgi:hypothetical protein
MAWRREKKDAYSTWLKTEFGGLIDELELDARKKRFLRSRWLEQLDWVGSRANEARNRYYRLRLTTVIGAVLVPGLVSVSFAGGALETSLRVTTWVVSLVVAVSAAVEQFFHFGERWRNYRRTAERLKAEGWLYLELGGPYRADGATHESAFTAFATRVEKLLQGDVDVYLTEVAVEKKKEQQET